MRLRDRRVQMTYPVRLTCQVIGCPQPEIYWFKNGKPIMENGKLILNCVAILTSLFVLQSVLHIGTMKTLALWKYHERN